MATDDAHAIELKPLATVEFQPDANAVSPSGASTTKYPVAVWFILGNELGERFSYYGMRALLIVFLTSFLRLSDGTAITAFHLFTTFAYLAPLLGGYISDAHWGRYKTILILSVVYICGSTVLSISAIPSLYSGPKPTPVIAFCGLALIALGTGGIKPCVSSFGGDQFKGNKEQLRGFFNIFYICINVGSLLSIVLTPLIHDLAPPHVGFVASFALPAALLAVATGVFWLGRRRYHRVPPTGSVVWTVVKIVWTGLRAKCSGRSRDMAHWLDAARAAYPSRTVDDVKVLLRVLVIFLMLPMFWALYDQQGSRWTLQALDMDRHLFGWNVPAAAIQAVNAALILILAPLFERVVYPLVGHCVDVTPLRRMGAGMLLCAVSFFVCALVQMAVDRAPPLSISVWWQLPQYVIVTAAEVLASITGLEFAYAEAPNSMKSVVMACFLLTVAAGDLFVAATGEINLCGEACNFFVFGVLMIVALAIFCMLAMFYTAARTPVVDDSAAGIQSPSIDDAQL